MQQCSVLQCVRCSVVHCVAVHVVYLSQSSTALSTNKRIRSGCVCLWRVLWACNTLPHIWRCLVLPTRLNWNTLQHALQHAAFSRDKEHKTRRTRVFLSPSYTRAPCPHLSHANWKSKHTATCCNTIHKSTYSPLDVGKMRIVMKAVVIRIPIHDIENMFVYVYIYVYIYIYIYINIYIYLYTHKYACICIYIYTYTYRYTYVHTCMWTYVHQPASMDHVKYLRAGPTEMPFQNWYTANTNHFQVTDFVRWKSKTQLGWVINPVPHNLVRRIRFWRIKISGI